MSDQHLPKKFCEVVPHPAGGLTLAVPVEGTSCRIYVGRWAVPRARRARRPLAGRISR